MGTIVLIAQAQGKGGQTCDLYLYLNSSTLVYIFGFPIIISIISSTLVPPATAPPSSRLKDDLTSSKSALASSSKVEAVCSAVLMSP